MVICDDADIQLAIKWALLSSFSNAGQRCASASRIIIFEDIYDLFVDEFIKNTKKLKLGVEDDSHLGPIINLNQYNYILKMLDIAKKDGAIFLTGANNLDASTMMKRLGFYIYPTILSNVASNNRIHKEEVFGPVTILYKVKNMNEALDLAHNSDYGLTASIHTKDIDRAIWFSQNARFGVINNNIGTYGSEPHMPFGGFGLSGNGTREPGVQALDIYSELKSISFLVRKELL